MERNTSVRTHLYILYSFNVRVVLHHCDLCCACARALGGSGRSSCISVSVAPSMSRSSVLLNKRAVWMAVGVPNRGSAPLSFSSLATSLYPLNITPANGDCPRSLGRLMSAPRAIRPCVSSTCPLYAASISSVLPEHGVHRMRVAGEKLQWYHGIVKRTIIVRQVRWQPRIDSLQQHAVPLTRRIEHATSKLDGFRREIVHRAPIRWRGLCLCRLSWPCSSSARVRRYHDPVPHHDARGRVDL